MTIQSRPSGALPSAPPPLSFQRRPQLEKQVDEDGWEIATNQKRAPAKKYNNTPKRVLPKQPAAAAATEPVEELAEAVEKIEIKEPVAAEEQKEEVKEEVVEEKEEEKKEEEPKAVEIPLTEDDSDSDGGEWITPDNVDEYKAAEIGVTADELRKKAVMAVGCMTADFAMQNVLLQMNLNLVSAGGYRVKKIRNSVMRCHACFL